MLQDILKQLHDSDEYPMHMPGHKRHGAGFPLDTAYGLDITEIAGYDNLYDARGILRDAMEYAGELYGCSDTFYLLNGATGGIHIAIRAVAAMYEETHYGKKGRLLIASNCHRSVRAAAELSGLMTDVIEPEMIKGLGIYGAVSPLKVEERLAGAKEEDGKYAAVVITSPTYEGIISDIEVIADICHRYDTILITDEAHGAHLDLSDRYPKGALRYGSDIVIHSTHKTLAAMTQTALLHAQGSLVNITTLK
ncbi:MAG: decarboxylase, partial [Lachnospiraceae bacterium]|nr:decarboxylase [Lachnospiraceae bacterium]